MEKKIKYQYTYFIKPFIIQEELYNKYIQKLLADKKMRLKIFTPEKDVELDTYFQNNVKDIMFKSLLYSKEEIKELENIDEKTYSKALDMPCLCFECEMGQKSQAKMGEENGIFFKIEKIEIICFKPGICFIAIKTYLDEDIIFNDILNFNYNFKNINGISNDYNKINIQSGDFKDKTELMSFLQEITGNSIDKEEFYTFSYVCIDGEEWNKQNDFSRIEQEFKKLVNVNPVNEKIDNEISIIEASDYIKIGISKNSTAIITNSLETYNYSKLPFEYENQYMYTLIYALYQKVQLKQIGAKLGANSKKYKRVQQEVKKFVNTIWAKEITSHTLGSKVYKLWREELELDNVYLEIANKYEMLYKDERMRRNKRNNKIIWGILATCLVINIINVIILANIAR